MTFSDYFSAQVFFLVFREVLETAVIVSVLLSFLKMGFGKYEELSPTNRRAYDSLFRQVWVGSAIGIGICFVVGGVFLAVFQLVGTNLWDRTEKLWEAFFCITAAIMITFMGISMLRVTKMKSKWRLKLARAIVDTQLAVPDDAVFSKASVRETARHLTRKYSLAFLPMITTMREGLEAIAFLGGLGASAPSSSFPLAVLAAVVLGVLVGKGMYDYGVHHASIKFFLLGTSCFLYLVSAGLFSRGVWFYEMHLFIKKVGSDVGESGSGPGSYDITKSVWHVNCCNPETDGFWMIFNALLGWQNSATYGSVISYNLYWVAVILIVLRIKYRERVSKGHGAQGLDEENRSLISRAANIVASEPATVDNGA